MKRILYSIFVFFFIANCTLNKVISQHGVNFLEKKQEKLTINYSNTNDIIQLLGPASTKSTFDNDMWFYIERVKTSSKILKLGKKDLIQNNVLILEISNEGILKKKIFINKDKMNNLQFTDDTIDMSLTKKSFVYDFLSTLRKKINDPLGKNK